MTRYDICVVCFKTYSTPYIRKHDNDKILFLSVSYFLQISSVNSNLRSLVLNPYYSRVSRAVEAPVFYLLTLMGPQNSKI